MEQVKRCTVRGLGAPGMQGADRPAFFFGLMSRWLGDRDRLVAVIRYHCKQSAERLGPIGMWQHCPEHEGGSLTHEWPEVLG